MAASDSFRFPAFNFIKKETLWILPNFYHMFLKEHLRMAVSFVNLWIFKIFSEHLFYRASPGNCLFHAHVAGFQPPYTVKNFFTGAFQAFCTIMKSSQSKAFIYLKSPKIICEEVNSQWSRDIKKKLFYIFAFMYFIFIFSEYIKITSGASF